MLHGEKMMLELCNACLQPPGLSSQAQRKLERVSFPMHGVQTGDDACRKDMGPRRVDMRRRSRTAPAAQERGTCRAGRLGGKTVAFTTPAVYAPRLEGLLKMEDAEALWCPTIAVESTAQEREEVEAALRKLGLYGGIAFTSRAGIKAVAQVLQGMEATLAEDGDPFVVAALGKDAELLVELDLFKGNPRVKMLIPSVASPLAFVEELGDGNGQSILCPVPVVVELDEPPVVPSFLQALCAKRWNVVRLNAYVTRWAGLHCADPLFTLPVTDEASKLDFRSEMEEGKRMKDVDALIFTSTAEVAGLIKSLHASGLGGLTALKRGPKAVVLAAHGPVTAAGAARLGVKVDVVSEKFHSFVGVVDALVYHWKSMEI